jgi:hypothetical protein
MPPQLRYSSTTTDTQTDAVCALLDNGFLQIYDGPQPPDGDGPASGTLLAELTFGDPAFQPSKDGVAWANPIGPALATATGEARWCRALSMGGDCVFDGNVDTANAVLNLDKVFIQQGANVVLSDFSYTSPKI